MGRFNNTITRIKLNHANFYWRVIEFMTGQFERLFDTAIGNVVMITVAFKLLTDDFILTCFNFQWCLSTNDMPAIQVLLQVVIDLKLW